MRILRITGALVAALGCAGCVSSTLALFVRADHSAEAVITSHLFRASIDAADALFAAPDTTPPAPDLKALLRPPAERALSLAFGANVHLLSTSYADAPDGLVRTTRLAIDDITHVRLLFPSAFMLPDDAVFGLAGVDAPPAFSFSIRHNEEGNELLIVGMPAPRVSGDPNGPITTLTPGSREESLLKEAIKGLTLTFTVETEQRLLRSNAKAWDGNRATIVSLDLDKMINAMDEATASRMMMASSFQDLQWQLGDLPGAMIPQDREVFLEYEPQQRSVRPIPPSPPAPAPPDTEIYLASFSQDASGVHIGTPVDITNNPGYDNQPFFTPDSRAILFTSMRDGRQTDIFRYTLATKQTAQVTHTPESEYSPTVTPSGMLSVVRVELDGQNTQRLWQFKPDGTDPRLVLENVRRVGYHAWADDHTLALFILGVGNAPATLELADTHGVLFQPTRTVATGIGRSIQRIPGTGPVTHISFVERKRVSDFTYCIMNQLDPRTGDVQPLAPPLKADGPDMDLAWTPDGRMALTAHGADLYGWRRGENAWTPVASLERLSLRRVSRIAISPDGKWIALVADPSAPR